MPNIGPAELFVVLIIALVVFGPRRLPEVGRQIGRAIREFRNATADIRSELGIDEIRNDVGEIKSQFSLTPDDGKPTEPAPAVPPEPVEDHADADAAVLTAEPGGAKGAGDHAAGVGG